MANTESTVVMTNTTNTKHKKKYIWYLFGFITVIVMTSLFFHHSKELYYQKKELESTTMVSEELVKTTKEPTYQRNTYIKAYLVMGIDRHGVMTETQVAGSGGQADGIYLIAQDTARNTVKIVVIPRDTMTEIILTDLHGNVLGKDIQHLTLAYAYGDGREKSCDYMVEAVSDLFGGFEIDGYMAIGLDAITILNDAVGGVPVVIDGETVTLSGEDAETFVRQRDITVAQSALERSERQKEYMASFATTAKKKAGSDANFLTNIFDELDSYMVTDLSKDQYMNLGLSFLGSDISLLQEDMITLAGEGVETNLYDEFYPDEEAMNQLILDLFYRVLE